jgi:hypothetical protein
MTEGIDISAMQKVASLCGAAVMQAEKLAAAEKKIEDFGKVRAGFAKRATEAAKVLAERGVIDSDNVNTFVDKVAADASVVWDTVEKLAEMVSAPTLGGVSHVESPRAADDPFIREFLPGNSGRGNGYID